LVLGEALRVGSLEGLFKAMDGTKSMLAEVEIRPGRPEDRCSV